MEDKSNALINYSIPVIVNSHATQDGAPAHFSATVIQCPIESLFAKGDIYNRSLVLMEAMAKSCNDVFSRFVFRKLEDFSDRYCGPIGQWLWRSLFWCARRRGKQEYEQKTGCINCEFHNMVSFETLGSIYQLLCTTDQIAANK